MNTPIFKESDTSQIPALQLLINMGYEYLPPAKAMAFRGHRTSQVVLEEILKNQLQKINTIHRRGKEYPFSDANINAAIIAIKDLPLQDGFLTANAVLYDLMTLGKAFEQSIAGDKKSHTIHYVDWKNLANNVFHVTEEFSVLRTGRNQHYRPDIVLFINGIPTVIIECKSPALSGTQSPTALAVEQHIRNFSKEGIRSLYVYSNLLLSLAVNDGRYATTGTSEKFWSIWKELCPSKQAEATYWEALKGLKNKPLTNAQKTALFAQNKEGAQEKKNYFDDLESAERALTKQDELLYSLCRPERLLDLIRNFILYDNGEKKIARYQQFFAVKTTYKRISAIEPSNGKRKGGVIWHTQGSGKSLTMVMLAQMLATHKQIAHPKIILVTDRVDLDDQISDTFKKCQEKMVQRATTGKKLTELLEENNDAIITTIIHKFETAVKKIETPLTSPDIFVLIDEGHRTQYDTLNVNMQLVFPNACFIAFTGTPLMKKERSTANKFGGYIGKPYTVRDAVEDGAVLPLLYESRHNHITINAEPINLHFGKISEPLTEYGKAKLKRKFNTAHEINKADNIVYDRAWDISEHYSNFFQTDGTDENNYKPKAQLVAPTIKTALLYKQYLDEIGKVTSKVVVTRSDQSEERKKNSYGYEGRHKYEEDYFKAMIDRHRSIKKYEKHIINQFKKRDHPEIIIVVAKLLTGFDAPNNTILYLCRSLKEHSLLQAIARVNRVCPGKEYGFIIDYYGNLEHLDTAMEIYSGEALKEFETQDLQGTATNINEEIKKLPQVHAEIWDIFPTLKNKNAEITEYEEKLYAEDLRNRFYDKVSRFGRLLKMALSSVDFVKKNR